MLGVYAGFIDTGMAAQVEGKASPRQVAERTLDGIRTGQNHVIADEAAQELWDALKSDPAAVEAQMQVLWDEGRAWVF